MYCDTHVLVWLYQKDRTLFSKRALELIEEEECLISPMVFLELEYLFEIGKIKVHANTIVDYLFSRIKLKMCNKSFLQVIQQGISMKWTRDPFDRIIVAQASIDNALLLSRDGAIQTYYPHTIW